MSPSIQSAAVHENRSHDSTQVILIKTHKLIPISANKLKFHALIINPVLLKEKFNAHFTLLHVTGHTSYSPGCDMTRHRFTLTQLPCWLKYAMLTVQARHNITARLTRTHDPGFPVSLTSEKALGHSH